VRGFIETMPEEELEVALATRAAKGARGGEREERSRRAACRLSA